MPPKFFYFDLGKVMLDFSYPRMIRQMADVAGTSPKLVETILFGENLAGGATIRYERGELTPNQFYEHFCEAIGARPDRKALEQAANEIFHPIEASLALVERLAAAGNRLGVLSNINTSHWQFVTDGRYQTLHRAGREGSHFHVAVTSHGVGAMKPDHRIYRAAIEQAGVEPGEIFFTDDLAENVAGARSAGIDAVQFVGIEVLIRELRARNVPGA